ncbi:hypothetical protein THOM_2180 [Trachipleistophora hominis]|uniref:Uncharacterized protein n=1 Tax=Trachipleistophora hominis TaxID=72359 RepID=L7JTR7_TRAHO|nr:hypothetical protein THOM_2180 [Trachipleistophora hominis]
MNIYFIYCLQILALGHKKSGINEGTSKSTVINFNNNAYDLGNSTDISKWVKDFFQSLNVMFLAYQTVNELYIRPTVDIRRLCVVLSLLVGEFNKLTGLASMYSSYEQIESIYTSFCDIVTYIDRHRSELIPFDSEKLWHWDIACQLCEKTVDFLVLVTVLSKIWKLPVEIVNVKTRHIYLPEGDRLCQMKENQLVFKNEDIKRYINKEIGVVHNLVLSLKTYFDTLGCQIYEDMEAMHRAIQELGQNSPSKSELLKYSFSKLYYDQKKKFYDAVENSRALLNELQATSGVSFCAAVDFPLCEENLPIVLKLANETNKNEKPNSYDASKVK